MRKRVKFEMRLLIAFIASVLAACLTGCGSDSGQDEIYQDEIYYADVNGTIFEITSYISYSTGSYKLCLKNPYTFTTNDGKVVTTSKIYVSNINVIIYGDCKE